MKTISKSGFLLYEVMVAVSLVGIALATVLGILSGALSATRVTKDYLVVSTLLSQKMFETLSLQKIETGVREGGFADQPRYHWRTEIEEIQQDQQTTAGKDDPAASAQTALPITRLAKATLTISWDHRGKKKSLSAQTFMTLPPEIQVYVPKT